MIRTTTLRMLALAVIWGCGFLLIALALRGFGPVMLTLIRLGLGALVLVSVVLGRGERLPYGVAPWRRLTVAALVSNAIPYSLFAIAEKSVPSSLAGVVNSTTPIWAIVIGTAITGRLPGRFRILGSIVGFLGILVIFRPWALDSGLISWGSLACLVAASSYGLSYVYQERHVTTMAYSSLCLAAGQLVAASVLMVPVVVVAGDFSITLRVDSVLALTVLGFVGTGLAYVLNYRLIQDEGSAAAVVTYLLPIVAVAAGVLLLNENVSSWVLLGAVVVLLGVWISRLSASASTRSW